MNDASNQIMERAFKLAYFILGEAEPSVRVAAQALSKLEVTVSAQDKRLYYNPAGRSKSPGLRTKVFLNELHLLQRLVYLESEPYERRQEADDSRALCEEEMVIRFIKHLVRITLKRNSFYVALGINRLLHNYTTAEAMNIYNIVVQDPDRVRDDYYYRSRKKQLMREMQERFGELIRSLRGHRGEERFEQGDDQSKHLDITEKCLKTFTPWDTTCVLPATIDPTSDELRSLSFKSSDPDQEHPVELNRIHSVTHPSCYARLAGALRFDPPDRKLSVPRFFTNSGEQGGGPRRNRNEEPDLSLDDAAAIASALNQAAGRRRRVSAGMLSVTVDGTERARLDTRSSRAVQLKVEEGAELIEVHARDKNGVVLLAAHLLEHDEVSAGVVRTSSITLEGGQRLSFSVSLNRTSAGILDDVTVDVSYKETSPARAALSLLTPVASRWLSPIVEPPRARILVPIAALVLIAGLGVIFLLFRPGVDNKSIVTLTEETSRPAPERPAPSPQPTQPANVEDDKGKLIAKGPNERPVPGRRTSEVIRSEVTPFTAASLASVRQVHVDPLGDDPAAGELREQLIAALNGSVKATTDRENADAVFKGALVRTKRSQTAAVIVINLQLVNQNGNIIWSARTREQASQFDSAKVASRVIKRLVSDIEMVKNRGRR
jgi:hypothetical protein